MVQTEYFSAPWKNERNGKSKQKQFIIETTRNSLKILIPKIETTSENNYHQLNLQELSRSLFVLHSLPC